MRLLLILTIAISLSANDTIRVDSIVNDISNLEVEYKQCLADLQEMKRLKKENKRYKKIIRAKDKKIALLRKKPSKRKLIYVDCSNAFPKLMKKK